MKKKLTRNEALNLMINGKFIYHELFKNEFKKINYLYFCKLTSQFKYVTYDGKEGGAIDSLKYPFDYEIYNSENKLDRDIIDVAEELETLSKRIMNLRNFIILKTGVTND